MAKTIQGRLGAEGLRVAIVASRWNDFIVSRLIGGATDALERLGASSDAITIIRVPGSFELPMAAKRAALSDEYDAVICLGAVIRGDTPHFDYISAEASRGIGQAALDADVPIIFGVLTTHTIAQAIERSEPTKYNRGGEAARSAIEMATVMRLLRSGEETPAKVEVSTLRRVKKRAPRKRKG